MYSPKIAEDLIPSLYRLAKDRKMPMTRLVDGIIRQVLASNTLPQGKLSSYEQDARTPMAEPRPAVAA